MNALRDLFYVLVGTVVFLLIGLGMGHCETKPECVYFTVNGETSLFCVPPKQHFWQKHPTRTKFLFVAGGVGLGVLAHALTTHNCPSFYMENGKKEPYDGTPPCPK